MRKFCKYPNRRLYDLDYSHYVGLPELLKEVRDGQQVEVIQRSTGDNITVQILVQALANEAVSLAQITPARAHELVRKGL